MNNINFCGNLILSSVPVKFESSSSSVDDKTICDSNEFENDIQNMEHLLDVKRDLIRYDLEMDTKNIKMIADDGIHYHIPNSSYEAFFKFVKPLSEASYTKLLTAYNSAQTSSDLDVFV